MWRAARNRKDQSGGTAADGSEGKDYLMEGRGEEGRTGWLRSLSSIGLSVGRVEGRKEEVRGWRKQNGSPSVWHQN